MPTPSRPDPSRRRKAFVLAAAVAIVNLPLAARAATPSALPDGYRPACLLYTSYAADERSSVDLGGRRLIKKKTNDMCQYSVNRRTQKRR